MNYRFILYVNNQKEGKLNMCMGLNKIKEKTAQEILNMTNQTDAVPVNIEKIILTLGINLQETNFEDEYFNNILLQNEKYLNRGKILGAVFCDKDELNICYRKTDINSEVFFGNISDEDKTKKIEHRKRFTLAHELAHCCLHMSKTKSPYHLELRTDKYLDSEEEYLANKFAGELLIPEHSLRKIYEKLEFPSITFLADLFNVSRSVMMARLDVLNLSY